MKYETVIFDFGGGEIMRTTICLSANAKVEKMCWKRPGMDLIC